MSDPDVVVVGSGPNGLFAACRLARAGLEVLVCETRADRAGGALGHAETTLPGFLHDVGAGFVAFADSEAFREMDLGARGLAFARGEVDSAHPAPDGTCPAIADDGAYAETWGADADRWRDWVKFHAGVDQRLIGMLGTLPAVGPGLKLVGPQAPRLARMAASSSGGFARREFTTEPARRVVPSMGMHVDIGPEDRFGAAIAYMLAMRATTAGFLVPVGGAGAVTAKLVEDLLAHGGTLRMGARVDKILVREKRAVGVKLADGEEIACRGVLADTSAPALYLGLLGEEHLSGRIAKLMKRYPQGWGTFKVDFALDAPVPWLADVARKAAVVHVGDDLHDLTRFTDQVRAGNLPDRPYLVIGQQTLVDPSRAPPGKHTLYCYTRVPNALAGGWEPARELMADRMVERIEELAPGFRASVLGRATHTPDDLEAMSANLVGGDLGGGSNQWTRQAIFRPVFPYFRYNTPVAGAWLCSMYAHPGTGIHGMCGWNAAGMALQELGRAGSR